MKKKKDNTIKFPKRKKGKSSVEFIGPFQETWAVIVEGYKIPRLSAIVMKSGNILITLDERFMVEATPEEAEKWLWIVANALAIGEGYPWYGATSKERPFASKMIDLSELPK